ncbi:MAG: ABC transporter ATP-binding protein, partial [Calditrichia bacterium]|nr:ABC transporter ATP-binding protein [Calditrichia bacterium]
IFSLYTDLSVEENLKFYFRIHKMKSSLFEEKAERLYKFSRLQKFSNTLAGQLSGGMKQKLALSCALMHNPALLILDEPTTGVDPLSRKEFWEMLAELKTQGIAILVSTPYMDEAMLCDYIYLVHSGNILSSGEPNKLITGFKGEIYEISLTDPQKHINSIKNIFKHQTVFLSGKKIHISSNAAIAQNLLEKELSVLDSNYSLDKVEPTLEDLFLTLILQNGEIDG